MGEATGNLKEEAAVLMKAKGSGAAYSKQKVQMAPIRRGVYSAALKLWGILPQPVTFTKLTSSDPHHDPLKETEGTIIPSPPNVRSNEVSRLAQDPMGSWCQSKTRTAGNSGAPLRLHRGSVLRMFQSPYLSSSHVNPQAQRSFQSLGRVTWRRSGR